MGNTNRIWHEGIVGSVAAQTIEVVINNHSACSECHAKGACGMSEVKQKIITACRPDFEVITGDKVMVYAALSNAIYSVIVAYILPSILLVAAIFLLTNAGISEMTAAISGLVLMAGYFMVIYLCRNRMNKRIKFTVEKINNL